jgi:protein-S-isoprenylcysteine O-methyltransferase Ste14
MGRFIAFLYGLVSYVTFFFTALYAFGFVSDVVVPKTIDTGTTVPTGKAFAVNLLLICVFAIQHSVMARKQFKQRWAHFIPAALERSTYVLFSSLVLAFLFWQWRPMPTRVWQVADPEIAMAITSLSILGWMVARTSTFLINHFELFGLRQVANNLTGREAPAQRFRAPLFYKAVRHPIYLGLMIAFWVTPTMTVGHLLFAVTTTAYIFAGIYLEERDLVERFGEEYRNYSDRVPMLAPWYGSTQRRRAP